MRVLSGPGKCIFRLDVAHGVGPRHGLGGKSVSAITPRVVINARQRAAKSRARANVNAGQRLFCLGLGSSLLAQASDQCLDYSLAHVAEAGMAARFAGRCAVVTGGVSGIGAGIAQRLASEGARLSLWDRDAGTLGDLQARSRGATHTVAVDVTDHEAVLAAAAETVRALGRIDILIASAGITGPNAPVVEYPPDAWQRVVEVNLNGVFYCNRAVVPHMLKSGYGRIVNIASIAGKEGNPNAAAYSASKAGVIALTKSLGKELAHTEIRVNCVAPAAVRTPLFDQMTQQHVDFMLSRIPVGRFGEVHEIAALVCWLASEECSFSTGAVFDASGGRATY